MATALPLTCPLALRGGVPEQRGKGGVNFSVGSSKGCSMLVQVQIVTAFPKPARGHWPLFLSFSPGKSKYCYKIPLGNTWNHRCSSFLCFRRSRKESSLLLPLPLLSVRLGGSRVSRCRVESSQGEVTPQAPISLSVDLCLPPLPRDKKEVP